MKKQKEQSLSEFVRGLWKILKSVGNYIYHTFKEFGTLSVYTKISVPLIFVLMGVWAFRNTHFWVLHKHVPSVFTEDFVWAIGMHPWWQIGVLYLICSALIVFFIGGRNIRKMKNIEFAFTKAGIKNAIGVHPKVKNITNLSAERQKLEIDTEGVPWSDFESKRNHLRASSRFQIEAIVEQGDPGLVELYLTKKLLPQKISYASVSREAGKPGQFVVGQAHGKVITKNLFELPHMLVAGTTGMGKSYFLRQMLLNLLENTPNLQVYALDFKEGIAMKPFKAHPNVKVIQDVNHALVVLEKVKAEMKARFKLLSESEDDDVIIPEKHKKDPIVVLIDECSMLYMSSGKSILEKQAADKATRITDEIAKLSRAAHIHLVLGTQKITKETVSTHIQENIEGRICFKVTSIQGSALVVGTKIARDLPAIKGRAISKFGVEMEEIQTPFISTEDIKERVQVLKESIEKGERKTNQVLVNGGEELPGDSEGSLDKSLKKGAGDE